MKSLKTIIVFMSCLSLFSTISIADEDAVVEEETEVIAELSDEDREEVESVLDALEDHYGDQNVMIIATKSDDETMTDEEMELDSDAAAESKSDKADETGIQISIIKNKGQDSQGADFGTAAEMEQTSAQNVMSKRRGIYARAVLKTFKKVSRKKCGNCRLEIAHSWVRSNSPSGRGLACRIARNMAWGRAMNKFRGGGCCAPAKFLGGCRYIVR